MRYCWRSVTKMPISLLILYQIQTEVCMRGAQNGKSRELACEDPGQYDMCRKTGFVGFLYIAKRESIQASTAVIIIDSSEGQQDSPGDEPDW